MAAYDHPPTAGDPDEIRRRLMGLPPLVPPRPDKPLVERWKPFPVESLPEPIRGFVTAAAKGIGCDLTFIVMPLLAVLAAAIGSTRTLMLKPGWFAPSILWTVVIADSGNMKTPAHRLALAAMNARQKKALGQQALALREHERELAQYELDLTKWKAKKDTSIPAPDKPPEPFAERCVVSDTTVEALAPILERNPRGLLCACDELAGWINSFNAHKGGRGGDMQNWLKMADGSMVINDRKTGGKNGAPRTICVPHAYVSVTGGIQPGIMLKAVGNRELVDSGFLARLLLAVPPKRRKRWTDDGIDPRAEAELAGLIEKLYELQPNHDDDGDPIPAVVRMTRDAKAAWVKFYNSHAGEQEELTGDLAAGWSKLEQIPARLALVVHFVRWAAGDPTLASADKIDAGTMVAAITLAEWFKHETRRVYALLAEGDDTREQRELVELIDRKGGSLSARELQQASRRYDLAEDAAAALQGLAKAGLGCWDEAPATERGGRPTRRLRLRSPSTVYETPSNPDDFGGSVDVDSEDSPGDAPEWGEV